MGATAPIFIPAWQVFNFPGTRLFGISLFSVSLIVCKGTAGLLLFRSHPRGISMLFFALVFFCSPYEVFIASHFVPSCYG